MTLKHTIYMYTANFDRKEHFVIWGHEFIIDLRKAWSWSWCLFSRKNLNCSPPLPTFDIIWLLCWAFFVPRVTNKKNIPLWSITKWREKEASNAIAEKGLDCVSHQVMNNLKKHASRKMITCSPAWVFVPLWHFPLDGRMAFFPIRLGDSSVEQLNHQLSSN